MPKMWPDKVLIQLIKGIIERPSSNVRIDGIAKK